MYVAYTAMPAVFVLLRSLNKLTRMMSETCLASLPFVETVHWLAREEGYDSGRNV